MKNIEKMSIRRVEMYSYYTFDYKIKRLQNENFININVISPLTKMRNLCYKCDVAQQFSYFPI